MYDTPEVWQRRFAWLPHVCDISGAVIWLEFAYFGSQEDEDYWEPPHLDTVTRWITEQEYTWCKLSGEIE